MEKPRTIHYAGQQIQVRPVAVTIQHHAPRPKGWLSRLLAAISALFVVAVLARPSAAVSRTYRPPNNINDTDSQLSMARGDFAPAFSVHKFGRNPDIGGSTTEDISDQSATITFSSAPRSIRIKAGGNGADDPVSSGAGYITVEGVDGNFNLISEVLVTSGAAVSPASTQQFLRVYRAYVSSMGATANYETASANAGDIVIESTASTHMAQITAGMGQTQSSLYTVPAGFTCYLKLVTVDVDATKPIDFLMWQRKADDFVAPLTGGSKRLVYNIDEVSRPIFEPLGSYFAIPEKTDIWASGTSGAGGGTMSVTYDLDCLPD